MSKRDPQSTHSRALEPAPLHRTFHSLPGRTAVLGVIVASLVAACATHPAQNDLSAQHGNITTEPQKYEVVIDAGSSGTRAYLYERNAGPDRSLTMIPIKDVNDVNDASDGKAGPLIGFDRKTNQFQQPSTANEKIDKLLTDVEKRLKQLGVSRGNVNVDVLGTAGIRGQDDVTQQAIWTNVRTAVRDSGFTQGHIGTITGKDEGLFAWLDVNYGNGSLRDAKPTEGIVEIGGASAQVAFDAGTANVPDTVAITVNDRPYRVSTASFPGLGQDEARNAMSRQADAFRCFPRGYRLENNHQGVFRLDACKHSYQQALSTELGQVKALRERIRQAPGMPFVGLSGLYYTARFFNRTAQEEYPLSKAEFDKRVIHLCRNVASVKARGEKIQDAERYREQCGNGAYASALLFDTLGLRNGQLVAQDSDEGKGDVKLTWTRGYIVAKDAGYDVKPLNGEADQRQSASFSPAQAQHAGAD